MTTQVESSDMSDLGVSDKPSGPAAAVFVAAGIGSLVMGIGALLNEYSAQIKSAIGIDFNAFLQFDKSYGIGSGIGPLSGKVILAVLAFVISFGVLFFLWRRREINVRKAFIWTLVLVGLGFAFTFPPVFMILAS